MAKLGYKAFIMVSFVFHLGFILLVGSIPSKPAGSSAHSFRVEIIQSAPQVPPTTAKKSERLEKKSKETAKEAIPLRNESKGSHATFKERDSLPAKKEHTIALNTKDPKYMPYASMVKRKIELAWYYPDDAREYDLQGRLTLMFSILKNGHLTGLQLLQTSGLLTLDNGAINAVKFAAPYYPIPQNMEINKLNVIATFEYKLEQTLTK